MNRRTFFAAALPAILGTARGRALGPIGAGTATRQVKVKVDIVRARPDDVDAFTKAHPGFNPRISRREIPELLIWLSVAPASSIRTITVTTHEDVPTQVTVTEPMSGQNAAPPAAGVTFQHLSTSVGVTPHVNAGGTLTLQLSLEDTQYSLSPDPEAPRHILTQSANATHTANSGETFSPQIEAPAFRPERPDHKLKPRPSGRRGPTRLCTHPPTRMQ